MKATHLSRWVTGSVVLGVILFTAMSAFSIVGANTYQFSRDPVPLEDEYLIVQGPGDMFRPDVAEGGLTVWYARGESGLDLFGLRLGDDGRALDDPFLIAGGHGDQAVPIVTASTPDGYYLIVWHDQGVNGADVYARYLTPDGHTDGDPFVISDAPGDQYRPAAAYSPVADQFIVVWQDDGTTGVPDVYGRMVTVAPNGALPEPFVVSAGPGGQFIPDVVCEDTQPTCLLVWQDDRHNDQLYTDVMGQLIQADTGAVTGAEIGIAVENDYQFSPAVIFNPVSAEYLVVWDDDISARRVSRAGQPLDGRVDISLDSPYQYKPAVAVGVDGTYLIVWEDLRNWDEHGADIYGQWLSASGVPLGANFALSTDPYNQYAPSMVAGQGANAGSFFVVWEDNRASDASLALYGRWLEPSGEN